MDKRYNKKGLIGSLIFHVLVLLVLIFFGMKVQPREEEGVLVNLGNVEMSHGNIEPPKAIPKTTPPPVVKTPPPAHEVPKAKQDDGVKTQDFDEAPELLKKKREKAEKEKRKKVEQEQKRLEQERIAKEKALVEARKRAEEKRKEEAERKKREEKQRIKEEARKSVGAAFGKSNNKSTSEGDSKGEGNQGSVTGDPNSKNRSGSGLGNTGTGFSLKGRSLKGTLPQPKYTVQKDGVVVIAITVDKYGNVKNAVFQLKGSTSQDARLIAAAKKAAKLARFNADPNASAYQKGTITYHFELN